MNLPLPYLFWAQAHQTRKNIFLMKIYIPLLLALALGLQNSTAQELKTKASFSLTARGTEIFELEAGQKFYSFPVDADGWYKIKKIVYFPASALSDEHLVAGSKLLDEDEKVIGKTLEDVRVYEIDTIEQFRGEDRLRGVIRGYIFRTKLKAESVPEEVIGEILVEKNRNLQQARFAELWHLHNAEKRKFGGGLIAYAIRAKNESTRPEQDFRVIVVFRGETMPYAVITNNQDVKLPKVKEEWEEGSLKVQSLFKTSPAQKEEIEKIMYSFLAL